jgi:hypothetical protein
VKNALNILVGIFKGKHHVIYSGIRGSVTVNGVREIKGENVDFVNRALVINQALLNSVMNIRVP